jgi:predicted RNA-binding Zn-ribbon protein involved in translation (DUF1610 family)
MSDSKFVAIENGAVIGIPVCNERCKDYIDYYESDEEPDTELKCKHILTMTNVDVYREETYCTSCLEHWKEHIEHWHMQTTMLIIKGRDYSDTILATPIMFEEADTFMNQKTSEEQTKICPRCDEPYRGHPARSRRDNKTDICSDCGNAEAMNDYVPLFYEDDHELLIEKRFHEKLGIDFSVWVEWKKSIDKRRK